MKLSQLVAGTMRWGTWGANFSTKEYCQIIEHSLAQGISSFDGADIYGHYTTEASFGKALHEMQLPRSSYQLISKAGIILPNCSPYHATVKHYNTSRNHLITCLEQSVALLGCEYLDVFLVHRPSPLMQLDEIAETLQTIVERGLATKIGVSNFSFEQIELLQRLLPLQYHQFECSLWHTEPFVNGIIHQCEAYHIQPMAWSPLGGGIVLETNRAGKLLLAMNDMAKKYGISPAQVAFAFLQSHPSNMHIVTGTTKAQRLTEAASTHTLHLEMSDWFTLYEAAIGTEVP